MQSLRVAPDAPFFIVLNTGSGRDDAAQAQAIITGVLTEAGRAHTLRRVDDPKQLHTIAQETVAAARAEGGVVVVAGGDGTINAVAHATLGSGCAFGVLPQGTFNYFSRAHGIPSDTAAATRLLLSARAHPVQVGQVNGRVFLVNASLGLYPQLLEDRETWKKRFGRTRPVAFVAALATVLRFRRQLSLLIDKGGGPNMALRTPTLFVGNNPLQFQQIGIPEGAALANGQLVAVAVRPVGTGAMLWLLARGAFGSLGDADHVQSFSFKRIAVQSARRRGARRFKVATDGEVAWLDAPIEFGVAPEPLFVLKPEPGEGVVE